jgi:hypothetical protein
MPPPENTLGEAEDTTMKKSAIIRLLAASGAGVLLSITAAAAETDSDTSGETAFGIRASTQGAGIEVSRKLGKSTALRVGLNYTNIDFTSNQAGIEYQADFEFKSANLFLDYYPRNGPFRLTGGLVIDQNKASVTALPGLSYTIGDITFTEAEVGTLEGSVSFSDVTPYVGIGIGNPFRGGKWTFTLEAGAYLINPQAVLTSTGGTLSNDPALLAEIEREVTDLNNDMDSLPVWPVIGFTLSRRF